MLAIWAKNRIFNEIKIVENKNNIIYAEGWLAGVGHMPFLSYKTEYGFYDDGSMRVKLSAKVRENCMWLQRLGFEFKTLYENDKFRYFGRGPVENYCDMHLHTTTSWYESSAKNEYFPYIMPQEHGNHTNCRELEIHNGLKFTADQSFEINVSHYNSKSLTEALHIDELKEDDATYIRIDYKNSGIGSHSCGPELMEKYRLSEKQIDFEFYIS